MRADSFNLQHTLESGQFFRYEKRDGWYHCHERDKHFQIRQDGNELEFKGTTEKHIRKLFGLDQNYKKIIKELSKDKTLLPAIKKYQGLRVMNRDPWETLISFQCSIMSNIKKIQKNVNMLSHEFGERENEAHHFPAPGKINNLEKIKKCATGFRAKYIHEANKIVDEKYFKKLSRLKYEEAMQALVKLPGVGEKVADCICLFALGKMEAFPSDVWIQRVMAQKYGIKPKEIKKFARERWGNNKGYAQQFLYHWSRNER